MEDKCPEWYERRREFREAFGRLLGIYEKLADRHGLHTPTTVYMRSRIWGVLTSLKEYDQDYYNMVLEAYKEYL